MRPGAVGFLGMDVHESFLSQAVVVAYHEVSILCDSGCLAGVCSFGWLLCCTVFIGNCLCYECTSNIVLNASLKASHQYADVWN